MYTQFFGNYLLKKELVTPEQLLTAISQLKETHIKLGTLAIHQGYMTAAEVDEVCFLQTREDRRFGEIAINRNYLTTEQVESLLNSQTPDFLLLGQILVDNGVINNSQLEKSITDYQNENEIYTETLNIESEETINELIRRFFIVTEKPVSEHTVMYLHLMFNNLIRFIGEDFTPMPPIPCREYPVNYCVRQEVCGPINYTSRIDMAKDVAIAFASRYAHDTYSDFDEYVQASLEDFLNLHNGLFSVNMSNDCSIELTLCPPTEDDVTLLTLTDDSFIIPIVYPFGKFSLIVTLS